MKPHHFALCAVTCLVVLNSGESATESANLSVAPASYPMTHTATVDNNAAFSLAYAAGVLGITRQQIESFDFAPPA